MTSLYSSQLRVFPYSLSRLSCNPMSALRHTHSLSLASLHFMRSRADEHQLPPHVPAESTALPQRILAACGRKIIPLVFLLKVGI